MIEPINMYEDLRSDKVGLSIMVLRTIPIWNKEKHLQKEHLFNTLAEFAYAKGWGRSNAYHLTAGMGFSYLYKVPANKRGQLKTVSDKLIRIVYLYSDKRMGVSLMYGEVTDDQVGRNFCSMSSDSIAKDFDVRSLYRFAYGEPDFNGSTANPNCTRK